MSLINDKVQYPGCGGVGRVLRVRTRAEDDEGEEGPEFQEVYVQWPDSGDEYVKPMWQKSSRLRLVQDSRDG